jgi:DnaJ like chaperone protein
MSSPEYYEESADQQKSEREDRPRRPSGTDSRRVHALATLGLEEGASSEEIVRAYRRLVKVHHPDRFESLGAEAVRAATQTFQRIQAAYEFLRI